MNVFGYTRVSGKGQVDGDGPERQLDAIGNFCMTYGLPAPLKVFSELAVSGTVEAMDRPQFAAMVEAIADAGGGCIVVERMDRLARDLRISEFLLAECRKRCIPVYSADQGALIDIASSDIDPTRTLLRQILGALAEWEKSVLVMKLRKARDRKRAATGRCEGPKPFGLTPFEAKIKEDMALAKANGASYQEVADWLNSCKHVTKAGKPWNRAAVYQVLNPR
jgi:DNA invertase Pin-like site-specific DNA recombinase